MRSQMKRNLLVGLGLLLAACGSSGSGSSGATGDAGTTGASCADLTYDTFGKTFLDTYCISCHGSALAEQNIRFDTLAGLTSHKSKALSEVSSGGMPPRGATSPSSDERAMFEEWIQCGAN